MLKQELITRLRKEFEIANWMAMPLDEFPNADLVLKTPCFAVFFKIVEDSENLEEIHKEVQGQIAKVCGDKEWPRDLELVFLIMGDTPLDPASVRKIIDDRYVCRKFVLNINKGNIADLLGDLPFWPPKDILGGDPVLIGASVPETVKGYDPHLIADFSSHSPGAKRIFEKIRDEKYELASTLLRDQVAQRPAISHPTSTKLEGLEITDFRGIRHLRFEDMPLSADVVFIYGPNGVGKTSIADAVEWAITGQVNHIEQGTFRPTRIALDPIVNVFSESGKAHVVCRFSNRELIRRTKDGRSIKRLVGKHREGNDRAVIDHVVGTKPLSRETRLRIDRLRALFRSSHMLSQHDIRQFLERTEPEERFDILTNMIGAEEFVRFREKVTSVLHHVQSHAKVIAETNKSLQRELEEASTRLRDRQKDLEKLRQTLIADKSPEELISEMLAGLQNCHCKIDDDIIQRVKNEPADQRFEILAIYTDSLIQTKQTELEDLLVRLNSLEKGLQGYVESRTQREKLAAEIANITSYSEKAHGDLQKQEKELQNLRTNLRDLGTRHAEVAQRYANLSWLRNNLPTYIKATDTLRHVENALSAQQKDIRTLEEVLEGKKRALGEQKSRLQELKKVIVMKTNREQVFKTFLERLPAVMDRQKETNQLSKKEILVNSQIAEFKQKTSRALEEINMSRSRLNELQRVYDAEASRYDMLNSFLVRLAELVHSAECPLCGRTFASTNEAKAGIQEHLSCVPLELRNLARQLDEAKKDAEAKQAQANSITERINALENESKQIISNKIAAMQAVKDFIAECAALDVHVVIDDPPSWQNTLEEALRECETSVLRSEVSRLKNSIDALASEIVQQEKVGDELRPEINHNESERSRLGSTIQLLEAEMLQRRYNRYSLPEDDEIAQELETVQPTVNNLSELVSKKEVELRAIESAVAELRKDIQRTNEEKASKETQFRQYESACNRFVAECRAIGVDPENPKESIRAERRSTIELRESLASIEKKRQVLQHFLSLERLGQESEALARDESKLRQNTEASEKEYSRLQEWMSCINRLGEEVVKKQINIVGAHLERLEPTTQRLYHRLNPHPVFGKVRIRFDEKSRRLDVEALVSIACENLREIAVSPLAFFSDAQMNALAITVFMAGALRQRWSGLKTILIDDPVQQMDEMNVCAFLDLIRGLSGQRQFIIFTCSRGFYLLGLEKLDCLNKVTPGSFFAYRLEGIAPDGLKVHRDA